MHRPQQRIGNLELEELLGQGAFAEVWRARHHGSLGFTREVAVKLLKADREDEAELVEDLLREGAICVELTHRNIVDVFSVEHVEGLLVAEMELITGGTVLELIRRLGDVGLRVPRSAVLDIGIQVCAGLDYAWTGVGGDGQPFGVVHRDLKPANLLLTEHGEVRIADFGLAKRQGDPSRTAVGTLKGTPSYAAPETFSEGTGPVSPAVDMFALGCVLFELWTGRVLHGTDTLPAVVTRIIMGKPAEDVAPLRREFPELAAIVEELLERDPERRLGMPDVGARLTALRAELSGDPDLATLMELSRCLEAGERATRARLDTRDPDWLTLWRRVQQRGASSTTVVDSKSIEEPAPVPEPVMLDTAQLPPLEALEPVMLETTQLPPLEELEPAPPAPARAPPAKPPKPNPRPKPEPEPGGSSGVVLWLVGICGVLLVGIVVLLLVPHAPEPAAPRGACLVLGSSPPGAQVWIDGAPTAPAGDHQGAPRWHAPGALTIAMGVDGAEVVRTRIEVQADRAIRVVCSVADSPSCLAATADLASCP